MKKINTNHATRIKQIDKIIVVCLFLMLLVIPLTVKLYPMKFISPTITDYSLLKTGDKFELNSSYKFFYLLIGTFLVSVAFSIKIFVYNYEIKKTKMNLFLLLFIFILLLSTILSSFKYIALFGQYNQHEGVLTILCYSFILFITANVRINRNTLLLFFYILTPFILINSALSLLNFYGYNVFLKLGFIRSLIYSNLADQISFSNANTKLIGTLSNVDYISGISSLFICLFFILSIFEKRKSLKIMNIILLLCSFSMLLSSLAASGFITIVVLLPIILIILLIKKEYKKFLLGLTLLVSFSIIYIPLQHHNDRVWNETFGTFIHALPTEKDNNIALSKSNKTITPPVTTNTNDRTTSKFELPKLPEKGLSWGSGRGYIWQTTLSIIFKQPVLGYGLDTLSYYFPHLEPQELAGLGALQIVEKPHSLYLGIAFGTGILGLIVFLFMILPSIFNAALTMVKMKSKALEENFAAFAIVFVLLAYLIQGLINDANIGYDIIFFVFLGLLNSIRLNKENDVLKEKL